MQEIQSSVLQIRTCSIKSQAFHGDHLFTISTKTGYIKNLWKWAWLTIATACIITATLQGHTALTLAPVRLTTAQHANNKLWIPLHEYHCTCIWILYGYWATHFGRQVFTTHGKRLRVRLDAATSWSVGSFTSSVMVLISKLMNWTHPVNSHFNSLS